MAVIRHGATIDCGGQMTREYYLEVREQELTRLAALPDRAVRLEEAAALLDALVVGGARSF